MINENAFLFHALFMGIFITFVYDLLRIFRRVIPHKNFLVSLEDLAFWIYCAVKVFLLMYYESNGTLRWFAVLGALTGMFLYLKFISPFFVESVSFVLRKSLCFIGKIGKILLRPAYRFGRKMKEYAHRKMRKAAVKRLKRKEIYRKFVKKKLTLLKKALKMNM